MGDVEYNTAVMVMGLYGGLLQQIVKEYGFDRALEMHARMGYPMGVSSGEEIKKAALGGKPSLAIVEAVNSQMMSSFGTTFKVSKGTNTVKYEVSRCPMYDGYRATGFSDEQIKRLCGAMAPQEYVGISSVVPNVTGSVKVREGPKGCCIEEFKVQ